jgi:hypothetical protein
MSSHFFQGEELPLEIDYHPQKRSHLRVHEQALRASLCYDLSTNQQKQQLKILFEKLYRQSTLQIVEDTLKILKPYLPRPINRITIKKLRSRWGSCSLDGNLNFNLDLAKLPPPVQQYVVIHEFSHLFQMNHSPRFWEVVGRFDPHFKQHRRLLRHFEKQLHLKKEGL